MRHLQIGTSGYSFPDWVGPFYPPGTPKGEMLNFYSKHFSTVELNSTYYRIMHPKVSWNMVNKTPEDFQFTIKPHSGMNTLKGCLAGAVGPVRKNA